MSDSPESVGALPAIAGAAKDEARTVVSGAISNQCLGGSQLFLMAVIARYTQQDQHFEP